MRRRSLIVALLVAASTATAAPLVTVRTCRLDRGARTALLAKPGVDGNRFYLRIDGKTGKAFTDGWRKVILDLLFNMRTASNTMLRPDIRRYLVMALIVGLPAMLIMAESKGKKMEDSPLRASIHVRTFDNSRALATVTYRNVSDGDIWLLRYPPNLYITLDGKEIQDIGRSEKRRAYTMADYDKVEAGAEILRQVEISEQFDFLHGIHEYTIQTGGGYKDPITGRVWSAPPAITKFELTR